MFDIGVGQNIRVKGQANWLSCLMCPIHHLFWA